MAYLGVRQLIEAKSCKPQEAHQSKRDANINSFSAGFLASLLNPKAIIFYMAFLPQFMDPNADTLLQFSILIVTSSIVVAVILAGYALIAARTRKVFQSKRSKKYFDYTGASFLIGSSVLMASTTK